MALNYCQTHITDSTFSAK